MRHSSAFLGQDALCLQNQSGGEGQDRNAWRTWKLSAGSLRAAASLPAQVRRLPLTVTAVLTVFFLLVLGASPSIWASPSYSESTSRASIEDGGDLLTDAQERDLLTQAEDLAERTDFELRIVTTDDARGRTSRDYAEHYFESLTEDGPDTAAGVCYLIDMDNRQFYMATYGQARYYLTDKRIDRILDQAYEEIEEQNYAGVFSAMLDGTEGAYDRGIQDGTRIYNEDTGAYTVYHKPHTMDYWKLAVSALAGLGAFLAVLLTVKGTYAMSFSSSDGYDARENVSLSLTGKEDRLVRHFVTSRKLPDMNVHGGGGGGVSTTHTTGGGYSAGGGGRGF